MGQSPNRKDVSLFAFGNVWQQICRRHQKPLVEQPGFGGPQQGHRGCSGK